MREGEEGIKFLFDGRGREVVRAEMSFGGKKCHVGFFNSFIKSLVTRNHLDTGPLKRGIVPG